MKKRIASSLLILAFAAAISILFFALLREPRYQGKTFSAWLDQFGTNRWSGQTRDQKQQARAALRHFGARSIPVYLDMISTRPSAFKTNLLTRIPPLWRARLRLPSVPVYHQLLARRRNRGINGLIALGADAAPAVPALLVLLDDRNYNVRQAALFALAELGPVARDAVPAIIPRLKDPDAVIRLDTVVALGNIHAHAPLAVPELANLLQTNFADRVIRQAAFESLGQFGADASAAVPALLEQLQDPDAVIRNLTINTLGLVHSRPDLAVPALAANLRREEGNPANLFASFLVLGQYGPDARSAVPALLYYTGYPNPDVGKSATAALAAITTNAIPKAGAQ